MEKTSNNNKIFICIGIIVLLIIIFVVLAEYSKIEIPNLVGKTIDEARQEVETLGLELEISAKGSDNIIRKQFPTFEKNINIDEGTTIEVDTRTEEEIAIDKKEEEEKRQKDSENKAKADSLLNEFVDIVVDSYQGEVKLKSISQYKTVSTGEVIYKIKYDTRSNTQYYDVDYHQLVSLNSTSDKVTNYTKLYIFSTTPNSSVNDQSKMDWEAEQLWGI